MSSLSRSRRVKQDDNKYKSMQEAAIAQITHWRKPKSSKKASVIRKPTLSSPNDDFILFPNDVTTEDSSIKQRARHREMAEKPMRHALNNKDAVANNEKDLPTRKRAPRHGGFRIVPLAEEHDDSDDISDGRRLQVSRTPPPAPSPPDLSSPDLSEVDDEDFWPCCKPALKPTEGSKTAA